MGIVTRQQGVKYLGVMWSPMPHDALDEGRLKGLAVMVKRAVARVDALTLRPGSKWYLLQSVLWGKVQWQLQFSTFTKAQVNSLEIAARNCAIRAAGLSRHGLNNGLVGAAASAGGLGWVSWWDRVMAKRLQLVSDVMQQGGALGWVVQEAMHRAEEKAGVVGNIFETGSIQGWEKGRQQGVLEQLAVWLAQQGMQFKPPQRVAPAISPGEEIVGLCQRAGEGERAREFCYECDKRIVSQLLQEDGETVCLDQMVTVSGETHPAAAVIRRCIGEGGKGRRKGRVAEELRVPKRKLMSPARLLPGDSVLTKEGAGWRLGQVQWMGVQVTLRYYELLTQPATLEQGDAVLTKGDHTQGSWERAVVSTARGFRGGDVKLRLESVTWAQPSGEVTEARPDQIDSRQGQRYVGGRGEWAEEGRCWRLGGEQRQVEDTAIVRVRMRHEAGWEASVVVQEGLEAAVAEELLLRPQETIPIRSPGSDIAVAAGKMEGAAVARERDAELRGAAERWGWEEKPETGGMRWHAFGDGTKRGREGGYGWVGRGRKGVVHGAGKCDATWGEHDSYRAESYGILAILLGMEGEVEGRDALTIWCDNSGVCRTFSKVRRGWQPKRRCLDVWGEVAVVLERWEAEVEVKWIRSHVETRKKDRSDWTDLEMGNHLADAFADTAYDQQGGLHMTDRFTTDGRWRLWAGGRMAADKVGDAALQRVAQQTAETYMRRHPEMGSLTEEHWYYTSTALGWVGSSSPQIRGANVKRLYGKVECDEELRHQHNCGGRKGKLQPPAVCATCNHGQETAAHMMQHCRCTQMRGRRQLFWRQYDAHMMRQPRAGSKREKLRWSQSPSLGMQRKMRLQNQGWTARPGTAEPEVRQFFAGMVNAIVLQGFETGGLEKAQWEAAAREHGGFMKEWFWGTMKLRDNIRK